MTQNEHEKVPPLWSLLQESVTAARQSWKRLTEEGSVFDAICSTVATGSTRDDWDSLRETILTLEDTIASEEGQKRNQEAPQFREGLEAVLCAAEYAACQPPNTAPPPAFDEVFKFVAQADTLRRDWAIGAAKVLRGDKPVGRVVTVPVAVVEDAKGWLGKLQIALFPGAGNISNHPAQLLDIGFGESSFLGAMRSAWNAAKKNAEAAEVSTMFDAVWRLLRWDDRDFLSAAAIDGGSISGAAANALAKMLLGMEVDRRVLVIAEVVESPKDGYVLGPVDSRGVQTKVERVCALCDAAAKMGKEFPIDRIAVVGEEGKTPVPLPAGRGLVMKTAPDPADNFGAAIAAIANANQGDQIDVVDFATGRRWQWEKSKATR